MKIKQYILLFIIVVLGFFLRIYGLNWDQGFHLHPDERFLTMVANKIVIPNTIFLYLDPSRSPLNPANQGFSFFVYGMFPLTFAKILAVLLQKDTYDTFTLFGRFLSAVFDIGTLFIIYKTAAAFVEKYKFNQNISYFAPFFYAISVLPIQLSHFFAVDTFLNFFTFASFYLSFQFFHKQKLRYFIVSAVCLGLAIACKITAIFIFPLNISLLIATAYPKNLAFSLKHIPNLKVFRLLKLLVPYLFIIYVTVRITDPYLFASENFFSPIINNSFISSIRSLESFEVKDTWYPPSIQWINKPIWTPFVDLVVFGIGIPYALCVATGIFIIVKQKKIVLPVILLWLCSFFIYQSLQFSKDMRYFILMYPFLAIIAAIGFSSMLYKKTLTLGYVMLFLICIWPASFVSLYTKEHSRVLASAWMYQNIPNGSKILGEYWDDPLPLLMPNTSGKSFQIEQLHVFDADTPEKWKQLDTLLATADYYVLSSNRAWGSILTVPEKYPKMSKFYLDLFAGKLAYKKIAEFTSYPSLTYLDIPINFPDDFADESFTVYDHPKVMVFKKE